jgi:hypothetical protein
MRSRGLPRGTRSLGAIIAGIALTLTNGVLANADSIGISFEPPLYHVGTIQDQPSPPPTGWGGQTPPGIPINPAIDQTIVTGGGRPSSFGSQSWRISNAYTSGSFADMPFSPSLANEAGETLAQNLVYSDGDRQNQFDAKWSFATADAMSVGSDSYLSISPDRGDGARMSYIRLEDHPYGIEVWFSDYQDNSPRGQYGSPATAAPGCGPEDEFTDMKVATVSRTGAHSVQLSIGFLDGPHNDVVKVYVDGVVRHTGTTWEDYFRWCTESGGGTGTASDQSRTVDSLLFRVGGATGVSHPQNLGKGFFIDNLLYTSSTSRHDCGNHNGHGDGEHGDKKFKFDKHGCNKDDRDEARHDDEGGGHHFQSSSVDSAEYESVGSGWQMTMVGSGVDNGEPVTFTIVALDPGALAPATYSIVLSNGYTWTGDSPAGSIDIE